MTNDDQDDVAIPLSINGFRIKFSAPSFLAYVEDVPDPKSLADLKLKLGDEWFSYWRRGRFYGIPKVDSPKVSVGTETDLLCTEHDHLHVLTACLTDRLPSCFPRYEAFRSRPFAFLGQRDEFVSKITSRWTNVPPLVQKFQIHPKFELDPRIVELRVGETMLGLFLAVSTRWDIFAPVSELADAGIDISGLHVIRRTTVPGERRLVGRIKSVEGDHVILSEAFNDLPSVPVEEVWLEGSKTSFTRSLSKLLGTRFKDFENFRDAEQGELLTGPGVNQLLDKMQEVLTKASPIRLTRDLNCSISGRIQLYNTDDYQVVIPLKPAEYCFDPARTKRNKAAWPGLERYGPYDRESFAKRTPRILVVCPDTANGQVSQALRLFRDGISSEQNRAYEKGFARTFHLLNPDFVSLQIPLFRGGRQSVVDAYCRTLEEHLARDARYDAAIIVILDEHARLPEAANPYLHAKALVLANGIPAQEVRRSTLVAKPYTLQYTFRNIAVALYAKMGGLPWSVDHGLTVDDELVIGIGTAELSGSRFEQRQRHIGITTVFRGDGNYLLSNLSRECSYDQYPDMLKQSTLDVLREIQKRNAWQKGDTVRVVFHAFKPLKNIEVAEIVRSAVQEVGRDQNMQFAFLTISLDHPFKLIDTTQAGISTKRGGIPKGVFAPERGLMAQLGRYTRLLCTNGPSLIKRPTSPLPSPLLIHIHRDSTYCDQSYLTDQVLKFTALSWRSTLPAERPVTIYYSELIAELLARLKNVPGWSPMVLNTKLRTSKWFL